MSETTTTPDYVPPGWPSEAPPAPPDWPPASAPPPRRRQLAALAIIAGIAVGAAAVSIPVVLLTRGNGTPSRGGSAVSPPASGSTSQAAVAYRQAITAMRGSSGFHYVAAASGIGNQRIVGDAGRSSGKQVITVTSTYGNEQFTLLLVSGTVYFQGNAPALEDQLGVASSKAPSLQSTWISVTSTDGPSTVLAPGITVADQAQESVLMPTTTGDVTSADGRPAVRITGSVPPVQGSPAGTGYLEVDRGSSLPIVYHTSINANGVSLVDDVTFSAWGTQPSVSAPSGAVAWSTLGATQPPGGYGSGGGNPGGAPPSPTGQSF